MRHLYVLIIGFLLTALAASEKTCTNDSQCPHDLVCREQQKCNDHGCNAPTRVCVSPSRMYNAVSLLQGDIPEDSIAASETAPSQPTPSRLQMPMLTLKNAPGKPAKINMKQGKNEYQLGI